MQKTNLAQYDFDVHTAGPEEKTRYFSETLEKLKQTSPQIDPHSVIVDVLFVLSDKSTSSGVAENGLRIVEIIVAKYSTAQGELPKSLEQNIRLSLEAGLAFRDYKIQEVAFRSLEPIASRLETTESLGQKVANFVTANWDVEQNLADDGMKLWSAMATRNPKIENYRPKVSERPSRDNYATTEAGYLTAKMA